VYKGEEPFASYLKKYFSANKKYGSKDRKQISHLCYCFFRLGKALMNVQEEDRILTGLFLCSFHPNEILSALKPEWNEKAHLPFSEKMAMINFPLASVFPRHEELSEGIDHEKYCASFFVQPDLFLRLRPGKEKDVKEKLQRAGIGFNIISDTCLAVDNATKVDAVLELDTEAVIQDYNSQQTGNFFYTATHNRQPAAGKAWDCCAGSGGKSIMLHDLFPEIELTVSDRRGSILINLQKRFSRAGIKKYKSFVADLTGNPLPVTGHYDLILADVPCTGSGTWGRTPEQLYFYQQDKTSEYAALQKKIMANVIPQIKPGGLLFYITCSVFKSENEMNVDFIRQQFQLELLDKQVLRGYDKKADTMFAALLKKPL
jgi:16S rRNA (cytosine967-C5)-methyltransferase